jgi:hypothetical protein
MTITQRMIPEFDHEMQLTRTMLERVPVEHADWTPHPKSTPLGRLAVHVSTLPRMAVYGLTQDEMDIAPPGGGGYVVPPLTSRADLLATFDELVRAAREAMTTASDESLQDRWSLKAGGNALVTMPRMAVLRTMFLNHIIHHRGQLSVYLRLLDVPLPRLYGPSADEPM